jgi:hypothetical protein
MKPKINFNELSEKEVNDIIVKAKKRLDDILANDRTPINEQTNGELIPYKKFVDYMMSFSFTNDDGIGYYATATESSRLPFKFFDLDDEKKLKKYKFTHILWFNR